MHLDKDFSEKYLVLIGDIKESDIYYVLAPDRNSFARLLQSMSTMRYTLLGITLLNNFREYDEFMNSLSEEDKPKGLNFG